LQFAGYCSRRRVLVTAKKRVHVLEVLFLLGYDAASLGKRIDVSEESIAHFFKGQ
jgi:hypothetical protein